jgi:hypothetical protein
VAYARVGEVGELHPRADQDVDRLGCDSTHHGLDSLQVGQARGSEYVRACLSEGSQSADGVVEIGAAIEAIIGASFSKMRPRAATAAARTRATAASKTWIGWSRLAVVSQCRAPRARRQSRPRRSRRSPPAFGLSCPPGRRASADRSSAAEGTSG